jgi:hypothetical protein
MANAVGRALAVGGLGGEVEVEKSHVSEARHGAPGFGVAALGMTALI